VISAGMGEFDLKFEGNYKIQAANTNNITIDGKQVKPDEIRVLKKGSHISLANIDYRLVLIPTRQASLPAQQQDDNWLHMLKAILS
jgi:hypothetical protein